jgi:hypothetical protein
MVVAAPQEHRHPRLDQPFSRRRLHL